MNSKEIENHYNEVRRTFPFQGYLDGEGEGTCFVGEQIAELKPARGKLLDIGSGPLDKTALFSRLGFECYACDDFLDPWHRRNSNLQNIKQLAQRYQIQLHIHENGDYTIPFPRNTFDVVCLLGVIEHLHQSPREILNVAGEMLAPGGMVVIVMPNSVNIRKRLHVLLGKTNYPNIKGFYHSDGQWRGHVREYTLSETAYILRETGFSVVKSVTFDSMIERRIKSRIIRGLYKMFTGIFPGFRDSLFVVGQKPQGWTPRQYAEADFRRAIARSVPAAVQ